MRGLWQSLPQGFQQGLALRLRNLRPKIGGHKIHQHCRYEFTQCTANNNQRKLGF